MIEAGPCLLNPFRVRLYVLPVCLAAALLYAGSAQAQIEDPVHVVPRPEVAGRTGIAVDASVASTTRESSQQRPDRLRVDVDLVLVPVVVTDTFNRPITSLNKDNFELLDDGEKQKIHFFSLEDGPLSIALVLDVSNSM